MHERIIINPEEGAKNRYGILAHVNDEERERIMNVQHGQFKKEVERVKRDLRENIKEENAWKHRQKEMMNPPKYSYYAKPAAPTEIAHEEENSDD